MSLTASDLARLGPAAQKQVVEKVLAQKTGKYHNRKTVRHGITFDSKHEADRARREVVKRAPSVDINEKSLIRVVQQISMFFLPVVERYVKTAPYGNDKLLANFMRMASSAFAARHVINPIHAFYVKRHMLGLLGYRKVAAWIYYFRQVNNSVHVFITAFFSTEYNLDTKYFSSKYATATVMQSVKAAVTA